MDRIDYSNDTATASARGPLLTSLEYNLACGAGEHALPQFGG